MKHPKLKYPRLCRILTYVVVLGIGLFPIYLSFLLPVPDFLRLIVLLASLIGLLIYLSRNFMVLMSMDMMLAMLSCYRTARTCYRLPKHRTPEAIRKSILSYGTECHPSAIAPIPSSLRYSFGFPLTIYNSGIERVIAAYEIDWLDREMYRKIFSSAKTNSLALKGRKKARFLDKQQKKQSLHRVTVILILAHRVDSALKANLYELICKECGDEFENCLLPCIVDLEQQTCTFNSLRVPYVGFAYAVKNRGIRIIKNRVFAGLLPLTEEYTFPVKDMDPEKSLWDMWKELHHEFIGAEQKIKRRFESMDEKEIRIEDDLLYLKWDHRGICQMIKQNPDTKSLQIEPITKWSYPKANPIGKKIILAMENKISNEFRKKGYAVTFSEWSEES